MAYTGIDKEIYESGTHFRPLQKYTQQQWTAPEIMGQNTNAGITATGAANPYKWPYPWLTGEGAGDISGTQQRSWSPNQNLGPTNITDYEAEAYGVGPTWGGTWARAQDFYSQLPTPTNLLRRGWKGIQKWRGDRKVAEEKRVADEIAQQKIDREQTIKDYSNWQSPSGRDHAGTGGIGSPESKAGGAPGTAEASSDWRAQGGRIGYNSGGSYKDWLASKGYSDMMKGMSDDDIIKLYDSVKGTWSKAQGGRIGYRNGEFVDENINVEGPGFDVNENLMASDDNNTRILENLFDKYIELGFSPEDAEIKAMEEFELMSQAPEQDQGIASLV